MSDIMQEVFDSAEELSLSLHHIAGCEDALVGLLDDPMALAPDKGRSVYAILAAISAFREKAAVTTRHLALLASG